MNALKLKPHPAAELFPMMSDLEIDELARDIRSHGQQSPVITWQGSILDGRNRYEACRRVGIEPKMVEWFPRGGSQSPTQWVLSENLHRRHLTIDQRALIALDALELLAKEAKARQRAAGGDRRSNTRRNEPLFEDGICNLCGRDYDLHAAEGLGCPSTDRIPPRGGKRSPTAAAQAAQATGVSARSVERARRVQQVKPEVLERVRAGEITLKQAEKVVVKETRLKEVLAYQPPKGRYAVIVADPPWRYDDTLDGSDLARGGLEYPTMSVDEICAMKVGENLGTPNCVLWLWVTNAFLLDGAAARVVREWGFTAKALLTWRKDRIGAGRYLRNQTEHVILAIKGSPVLNGESTPNVFDAPRRGHSEKPEKAFEIFERVSPAGAGARLELFARQPRKGWITSGSELTADATKKPAHTFGGVRANAFILDEADGIPDAVATAAEGGRKGRSTEKVIPGVTPFAAPFHVRVKDKWVSGGHASREVAVEWGREEGLREFSVIDARKRTCYSYQWSPSMGPPPKKKASAKPAKKKGGTILAAATRRKGARR